MLNNSKPGDLDELFETVRMTVSAADYDNEGGLRNSMEEAEPATIVDALRRNGWAISRTAQVLKISRKNLWEKMRRYQIKR